jgi:hypothetical protein
MEDAVGRIFWPGSPPLYQCEKHLEHAIKVADAMGFYLHREPVETAAPAASEA